MEKPLISVIVPIYMIDGFVGKCIESILNQTYKNLEILLVDDGSKDKCLEICTLYASKDSRVKVIHKSNGGLVSARKAGLRQSAGKYISYVDGDDWIGSGFIEGLYSAAETTGADMVCAGQTKDHFSKSTYITNMMPSGVYEGDNLKKLWKNMISCGSFYRAGISTYVWNKLFKREVLIDRQESVDDRISIGEDGAVTYPVILKCKKVVVTDNVAYHYRQREDSMLKQNASLADEAKKLKYLYDYMIRWSDTTDPELNIRAQVIDYILSIAIMRFGGRIPHDDFSVFGKEYYNKDVVIYSAGTFGQQIVSRLKESGRCNVVSWVDDDYWEYRRCILDVDPVEKIAQISYDYVLIATVDTLLAEKAKNRLLDLGVSERKILTAPAFENREELIGRFLNIEAIKAEEANKKPAVKDSKKSRDNV